MADPQTAQQQIAPQQQQDVDNGPAELSTANQPVGTTRVENGIAYDVAGKALGPANMAPKVDYKAIAAQMGGVPKVDYKAVAAQMGGVPSAPGTKTAPQQTVDLLTYALAKGKNLLKGGGEYSAPDNVELAQAKNASDYIYNNILGKNTYIHQNLTYDETPTSAAGKVWNRLWGWATQDEINKIPGLEPDRVQMLRASGNDLLSRMMGPQNAKDFRQYIEDGFSIPLGQYGTVSSKVLDPVANPEVYARAAAKTLTDFFSPGYYALGAFGKVAQGYQKAAQIAADAGDMAKAVQSLSKARLLAILSTGVNVPFAASQAHDLVEHWDQMNVPERVAAVAGILGASLNAHIGIQHMGGYSQVAHDAIADTKATAQDIAQSKAAQATKKAVGAMVTLGKAQTFEDAIQRGSALTGKKFRQQQANIRSASPELQAVARENPQAETPGQFADAIHNWLQQREQVLLQSSGGTKGSDTPVSSTLEADVRQRLDRFFDDNRGKYGNDEQVDAAKQQIMNRLMLQSKAAGAPPSLRMPNAFETENIRQGLNQEIKPQLNGTPTTAAYKAAVQQTVPLLREALDKFYNDKGVKNVKEFRAKEATMINVADRLEAAEKRAQEMGNGSIWSSLVKKFSVPTIITSIALGHNPLAFGALAPYLMGERAYQNYKNPGVNVRRALELAEPKPITDLDVQPPAGTPLTSPAGPAPMIGPSGIAHTSAPIHPTRAGQAAADVAAATMAEPPTNHALNAQLATHFGEPLDHAPLDDRIERVKNDAEAMRRSGVDISKTNTGKMLGAINEHESEHAAKIEAEQQKAHEDAAKVVQELHDEFQKLQEENRKNIVQGKNQPNQAAAAFALPYETTDEELPESKFGDKSYSGFNTRLHELGHLIWSHEMGLQPFDVISAAHGESGGAHAVARTDISRLLNPDGTNNSEAFRANLGDLVSRFLAGAVAEDVHGGVPMEKNDSARNDIGTVNKLFDALEVPEADRKRIVQQAVQQLRETFSKPEVAEIMNAFASKRKAGLSPEYHFDETQVHQLRQALDKTTKGEPDGTKETGPGFNKGAREQGGGVGEKPVARGERGGAPEVGRLQQAQAGLVERTTGNEDRDAAIRNGGGVPAGFMSVPGHGDYSLFHDPLTGSTLAFKPHEAITPQTVGKKLAASRAEFEAAESRKQGGHAGGGVVSVEELNRPGRFVKIGRGGQPTDQGKTPDFNLSAGEAGYQVTAEGPRLVAGQETPATKRGIEAYHKEVFGKRALQPQKAAEVNVPPELTAGEHDKAIKEGGAVPGGIAKGDAEFNEPDLVQFHDPKTGSTLALPAGEVTAEKVRRELEKSRKQFAAGKSEGSKDNSLSSRLVETFGTTKDPLDAGFILHDGRMVPLKGEHNTMMETLYDKYGDIGTDEAERTHFINAEQAVRTRYRATKGGPEVVFSVPKQGVTPEQIEQIKKSVGSLRNGNVVMEISEGRGKSAKKEFARVSDVEPMLKEIGAHPDVKNVKLQPRQNAPAPAVAEGADKYNEKFGRPAIDATVKPHSPEFAKRVADAYDAMKHEPNAPAVKKSYESMANEVKKQWDYATKEMGMKLEPWTKEGQPYANSKEMAADVRDNKHLYFFQGGDIKPESPMAKVDKDTGLTYNDMFRAVHDLFGHAAHGFEFGPKGEENAYLVHRQMFPAEAIPALTSETRGQNSWVNFGKHLRGASGEVAKKGEEGYVPPAQRPYAEQKVGLLPEEFHGAKSDWAAGVEKAPFGGVNPNNPEAPSKRYGFEIAPEHRHNPEALTAAEARSYAERPDVKAALAAHPDVKLGWDTTTQGPELNIGASTDDLTTAKKIAGKLDQRAIVNTQTGEEIPAGGEGKKTAFPEYPLADRLKDLDAAKLEKAKEEPKEFEENPEGFKYIAPQVLQHLEPDEQKFIEGNKRSQVQIQKHYDEIKPTIDETKAAMQAGQALGGWWRRYIDAFNALGEHTNEEVASKLGPKHADALKIWHAAVSGNKPVEAANRIAWGSYADWLDQGMPRDRDSINKILADNAAVTDTHYGKNTKKAGQVKKEGLDTTKLFRLVNSPEMRQIDPTPFHGDIFDPNRPSPIYGTTSGARKIPSMGATVAGEGNLNRLVLDTHMLDYFGEKKWTDNKYLAFSAHIRQAARELGLQPGEGQEQIWGTVLGIKKLLYEGLPDSEVPDELTNDLIEGIGKDYAQIIKDDPELSDIFERLKAHGIDPGGNKAQARLSAILEGKQPAGKAPANQTRLAESAARIRKNLKDAPEPNNTLKFNFGANALKMEQAPEDFDWEKATPEQAVQRAKDESYANFSLDEVTNGDPWLSEADKKNGEKPAISADHGSDAGFLHPDGSLSMVGNSYLHDVFSKELGLEDTDAFTKKTGSGTFDIWRAPGLSSNKAGLAVTLAGPPTDQQKQAILALTKHLRAGEPDDFKSVHISWPGKDVGVEFPTPGSVARELNNAMKEK